MNRYIIRHLQHLIDGHAGGLLLLKHMGGQIGIISDHVHQEGTAQFTHALTNAAEAQHAQSLATQLRAYELILVPVLVYLHVIAGRDGMTRDIQHFGNGQLGNGVSVQAGGVDDLDALLLRRVHINVVQTHGADSDDL